MEDKLNRRECIRLEALNQARLTLERTHINMPPITYMLDVLGIAREYEQFILRGYNGDSTAST